MQENFIYILFFILVVLLSITLHELGHFIFAKIFKVGVKEFSIGIGPELISFKRGDTRYSLKALPIAAYVMLDSKKLIKASRELFADYLFDPKFKSDLFFLKRSKYISRIFKSKYRSKYLSMYDFYSSAWRYSELGKNNSEKYKLLDDISKWKVIIISLGGILFNLILFTVAIIIWQTALSQNINFLDSIKSFFVNIWYIISWKKERYGNVLYWSTYWSLFVALLMNINLSLFLLNVLPIPPLDGFKVASALYEGITGKQIPSKTEGILNIIGILIVAYIMISSLIQPIIF